jgi:hypothetical protein
MRTESVRFSWLAGQQTAVDVALFTQWAEAIATDETELADFLRERFAGIVILSTFPIEIYAPRAG